MFRRRRQPPAPPGPDLRSMALSADPAELGFDAAETGPVWGALMDMAFPAGAATVVSFADGTTSMYTSAGGGVIGGGAHEAVVEATRQFIDIARQHLTEMAPSDTDALPPSGMVQFFALALDGRRSARAPESELAEKIHPLWPLFYAGHQVITALRIATEGPSGPEAQA